MKARYLFRTYKARYRDQRVELDALLSAIRPGSTVADVGANKGAYLHWLAKAVGQTGCVLAFEPQPTLADYLLSLRKSMAWSQVHIQCAALSDSAGIRKLHVPGGGTSPGASLETAVCETGNTATIECRTSTLDAELQGRGNVSALKVDVEGHELEVFRGGIETLKAHKPSILVECEARHMTRHPMTDVFDFLLQLGYAGQFFSTDGLRPIAEFRPDVHQKREGDRFWDRPDYCNNFWFTATPSPNGS